MAESPGTEERRSRILSLRVTPSVYDRWMSKVAASGVNASDFFRAAILANRTSIEATAPIRRDLTRTVGVYQRMVGELERIADHVVYEARKGRMDTGTCLAAMRQLGALQELFFEEIRRAG